jgi:hypothetical protein
MKNFFALILCFFLFSFCVVPLKVSAQYTNEDLEKNFYQINQMIANKDLENIKSKILSMEDLMKTSPDIYTFWMERILCTIFLSNYTESDIKIIGMDSFVRGVFEINFDEPRLNESQIKIIENALLYYSKIGYNSQYLQKIRKNYVEALFFIWNKLSSKYDAEWNININNNNNYIEKYYPQTTLFFTGMSPEDIEDKEDKRRYEEYLNKVKQVAKKNRTQKIIKEIIENHQEKFEEIIIATYSISPDNKDELVGIMNKYPDRQEIYDRILNKIKKNKDKKKEKSF